MVLIDYWNHVKYRNDDDRAVLTELEALRQKGQLVLGIANYGRRQEGRVTFFAQGPAKDPDYYYRDEYGNLVCVP